MGRRASVASVALLLVAGWLLTPALAPAQTDLAKVLVGSWRGELQTRFQKGKDANMVLALRITSVKQVDGKWVGEGRFGPNPVTIDIDTSGAKPALSWAGASGTRYSVSLLDEKNLVGTVTLTSEQARTSTGERDRQVKLEKQ
jgi:hypothetical protein